MRYIVFIALLLMAACGPADAPVETPAPGMTRSAIPVMVTVTPATEGEVRERMVQAIQRPGFVTVVHIRSSVPRQKLIDISQTSWLDLPGQRTRVERHNRGELQAITVVAEGITVTYQRDINRVMERPFFVPPESVENIPPTLNNPALLVGIELLGAALFQGGWRPAGVREWQGARASVWQSDFPSGAEFDEEARMIIYLESETYVPLGLELEAPPDEGEAPEVSYVSRYYFEFVAPDAVPEGTFDLQTLRELPLTYGGKLDEARGLDFTVVWLGKEFDLGEDYPNLELTNVHLGFADEVDASAGFNYRVPENGSDDRQGQVDIRVWQRGLWESQPQKYAPQRAWWRDPAVSREPILLDGVTGEFAIGYPEPLAPPPGTQPSGTASTEPPKCRSFLRRAELQLWLPDSVVAITASPIPSPPPPATPSEERAATPAVVATPDMGACDLNVFNTEEAMRALVRVLEMLR